MIKMLRSIDSTYSILQIFLGGQSGERIDMSSRVMFLEINFLYDSQRVY